jgi:hypothetical protein
MYRFKSPFPAHNLIIIRFLVIVKPREIEILANKKILLKNSSSNKLHEL